MNFLLVKIFMLLDAKIQIIQRMALLHSFYFVYQSALFIYWFHYFLNLLAYSSSLMFQEELYRHVLSLNACIRKMDPNTHLHSRNTTFCQATCKGSEFLT